MTEKRFTITGDRSISDHQKKRLYDLNYFDGMISVTETLNELATKCSKLEKENEQLKTQIKIFEKFLDENNLDIDWEIFCTVDECKKDSDDYGCKECKYLGDVE
jgi:uncharacterized protein YjaG (DUF416 family)